ncbi:MAG: 2-oxoglutarate dehydrogenase, E2 component, dihydrolipoamide succinyltransferase [Acidobacteriota bacterium]|nr:2-oxoglutarate dehydrogenase, E2 component, dihydrolipoamide succinyltransferase [Acidobacteriota bacterium]
MTDIVMPQMGESIVEGTLTKWLKKKGDRVERDEPLFEISTDKVDTEIPAPAAGVLSEVLVEEGKTVAISTVVGKIDESSNGAGPSAAPIQPDLKKPEEAAKPTDVGPSVAAKTLEPPSQPSQPVATSAGPYPVPAPEPEPTLPQPDPDVPTGPLSPLVRKMSREYNIDLRQVKGTGAGSRITKQDLESYMSAQGAKTMAQSAQPAAPPPPAPVPAAPPAPTPAVAAQVATPQIARSGEMPRTRIEPMSTMRQKIAEHMVMSRRTSAHVTTVHRVDMTKVAKIRERNKAEFQQRYGFSLTFLPFVTQAAVEAIRAYPIVNGSIEGTNIIFHNDINIGIAVALENGLIVPVIRNADEKNVIGLQRAIVDLSSRARSRQLKPDEIQGGTFSITNFGSFGSIFATPVINQPQVAILGVGVVEKVPVVIDDAIAIRSQCYLALTFDHRLVDGSLADQFTAKVKSVLENWSAEVL